MAVSKGPLGKGGVRLAIDYCFVKFHTNGDAFVMPHLLDSIQKAGQLDICPFSVLEVDFGN